MNAAVILITIVLLSVCVWLICEDRREINICAQHNYTNIDTARITEGVYVCYRTVAVNGTIIKEYGVVNV